MQAAPVARERDGEARLRVRRCGGADQPPRRGGRGVVLRRRAQQQHQRTRVGGGERQPPHRDRVEAAMPHLADDASHGATAQRLFHRPQEIAPLRDLHRDEPLGRKTDAVEAGAVEHATLQRRHVLGDPHRMFSVMAGHSRQKDGVASLAYVPAIHVLLPETPKRRGCPAQGRA